MKDALVTAFSAYVSVSGVEYAGSSLVSANI